MTQWEMNCYYDWIERINHRYSHGYGYGFLEKPYRRSDCMDCGGCPDIEEGDEDIITVSCTNLIHLYQIECINDNFWQEGQ